MTNSEARSVIAVLRAAFPAGDPIPEMALQLYTRLLAPYSYEQGQHACERLITSYQSAFMPPMAVILDAMLDAPPAIVAWHEVAQQVHSTGRYRQPEFSSPLVHEAVRRMGWMTLCDGDDEYSPNKNERDFASVYEVVCATARERGAMPIVAPLALPAGFNEGELMRDDETLDQWHKRQELVEGQRIARLTGPVSVPELGEAS